MCYIFKVSKKFLDKNITEYPCYFTDPLVYGLI